MSICINPFLHTCVVCTIKTTVYTFRSFIDSSKTSYISRSKRKVQRKACTTLIQATCSIFCICFLENCFTQLDFFCFSMSSKSFPSSRNIFCRCCIYISCISKSYESCFCCIIKTCFICCRCSSSIITFIKS